MLDAKFPKHWKEEVKKKKKKNTWGVGNTICQNKPGKPSLKEQ